MKCNGREVVTNFEPSAYESDNELEAIKEGGSHNLDLSLGIATPGHGPKENKGHLQFQPVPYNMHFGRSSRLDSTIEAAFYFGYEDKLQGRTRNFVFAGVLIDAENKTISSIFFFNDHGDWNTSFILQ